MAARATAALAEERQLLLTDLVLAECVYVLESFYEVERQRVAELMRSTIAFPPIETVDTPAPSARDLRTRPPRLRRAYLICQAEATGVGKIVSFDRSIDRITTITRREP
jgi:predicted nucleic-acid-binding protein